MLSFTFPIWEIHSSKEPVAIIQFPSRKQKEFKLRVLGGKYFYIRDGKKFEGIFELDPTKAYYSGNTPIYYFDSRNCKPFDWVVGQELVKFAKRNKMTKITHKDKVHSQMLQDIKRTTPDVLSSLSLLKDKIFQRKKEINDTLTEFNQKLAESPTRPSEVEMGYVLTNYLLQKGLITPEEKGIMDAQVSRGEMTLAGLVATLRDKEIISISEPFTREEELYLDSYGGYNPTQLTAFVRSLLQLDKGLRTMTSVPLKAWMPAGIIMALLIGGSIAVMILFNNSATITSGMGDIIGMGIPPAEPVAEILPPVIEPIPTNSTLPAVPEVVEITPEPIQIEPDNDARPEPEPEPEPEQESGQEDEDVEVRDRSNIPSEN